MFPRRNVTTRRWAVPFAASAATRATSASARTAARLRGGRMLPRDEERARRVSDERPEGERGERPRNRARRSSSSSSFSKIVPKGFIKGIDAHTSLRRRRHRVSRRAQHRLLVLRAAQRRRAKRRALRPRRRNALRGGRQLGGAPRGTFSGRAAARAPIAADAAALADASAEACQNARESSAGHMWSGMNVLHVFAQHTTSCSFSSSNSHRRPASARAHHEAPLVAGAARLGGPHPRPPPRRIRESATRR